MDIHQNLEENTKNHNIKYIFLDTSLSTTLRAKAHRRIYGIMIMSMLLSDLSGILLSVLLASIIRGFLYGSLTLSFFRWIPPFVIIFVVFASARGLYPAVGMKTLEVFHNLTTATSILFLITISGTFFFKMSDEFSRLLIGLSFIFSLVIIPLCRLIVRSILNKIDFWGEPVAIIGTEQGSRSCYSYFKDNSEIGLNPKVMIFIPGEIGSLEVQERQALIKRLKEIRNAYNIRTILVLYDQLEEFALIRETYRDIFEKVVLIGAGGTKLDLGGMSVRPYGDLLTLEIRHSLMDKKAQFEKRLADICVSAIGIILISPLLAFISILIRIDSPGSVIYHQQRWGKYGKKYNMFKFRTMRKDADQILKAYLEENPEMKKEWEESQKLHFDPRITKIGHFLRRYSLDELPQLINVLIGNMSLVGPRPLLLHQREIYGKDYQNYIRVLPGMTGLWQISGRNHNLFSQKIILDMEYINNWSIWLDIYILVRTFWVVIRGDGAY
jgi:Undecaprenyl-phosphate galactose phosphotransferase WbaP